MTSIRILMPGFLTTVQDLGRHGFAHMGVSAAGAADALAFRLGNLLVGNSEGTPALEMTLVGAEIGFEDACVFALAGADMAAVLDGKLIPMWETIRARPGSVLRCGALISGARAYICIAGGIDVPLVLGSASTHLATGIGGHHGRALGKGDILAWGKTGIERPFQSLRLNPEFMESVLQRMELRITPGPQLSLFDEQSIARFSESSFEVTRNLDRMGIRLAGPAIQQRKNVPEIVTEGVSLGAVQVTHSGDPIILFVDHQTTGGYPKIANVISADMHNVGQLRAGDRVSFTTITLPEASELLRDQEAFIHQPPFIRS